MESDDQKELEINKSDEEDVTTDERDRIRKELSTMSFEDLQKLKEKIGDKVYNETVYGVKKQTKKTQFKRTNKNRPREMSSKRPINIKKAIIETKTTPQFRDPRFDPLCGSYDDKYFKSNYKFLYNMRKDEYKQLKEEYENTENVEQKGKIKFLMQRLDNQIREHEKQNQLREEQENEKREMRQQFRRGERPVFKRKSEKKLDGLVQKYEDLKKNNKLQKHLEKKAKQLVSKEKKRGYL
nr:ribosomal RNA processing protein 36 homolog [Onthophagus taurus]